MLYQLYDTYAKVVALRKESVDRNYQANAVDQILPGSLSARRAWIEIPAGCWRDSRRAVALRKESVDRNFHPHKSNQLAGQVALRKESVDRNCGGAFARPLAACRSPQGERG